MSKRIRVILADDHVLVREGIRQFLEETDDIAVVGEASNGAEAIELVEALAPDLVLLDIQMPGVTGVQAARHIRADFPSVRILVLTAHDDEPYIRALLQAGADGYVLKTTTSGDLIRAIRDVDAGLTALSPAITNAVVRQISLQSPSGTPSQVEALTERELEVLRLTAQGLTNRQIGQELAISHRTVQGHLASIFQKLGVTSRTEAVTDALRHGWITME
ncbi:MAG: response regulator transcription factor [Anaerolineae bacterium]|nr:response regulator transcription factor [Anaerolineae bacterium]